MENTTESSRPAAPVVGDARTRPNRPPRHIESRGRLTASRSRWAAIGAAVAVTVGAGGISLVGAAGEPPSSYVPVTPCRVFDTRSGIGPHSGALGPDQTVTFPITGDQGQCTGIPANATAVALNVTTVDPTAWSYLTIWPSDETQPNASSLNYTADQGPTPNGVLADLSATGTIDVNNFDGTVHVIGDINGYFLPAGSTNNGGGGGGGGTIDAYTRAESDTTFATKADTYSRDEVYNKLQVDNIVAPKPRLETVTVSGAAAGGHDIFHDSVGNASFNQNANISSYAVVDLPMPIGAQLKQVRLTWRDESTSSISFTLYHRTMTGAGLQVTPYGINNVQSTNGNVRDSTHGLPANTPTIGSNSSWYLYASAPPHTGQLVLRAVTYTYEITD